MPFPYQLGPLGAVGSGWSCVRDFVECGICQYKGMGAMGTPATTTVPGTQLLTVPAASQYPLPSTGQAWETMQTCGIPFLAS